ncbi:MAG: SUMF1/EgtB/PvdO family nonheme iron enzyme [Deltaproteobacteria bacterium]|nr:SUMF1/EgtB/PvdO family nonheme iron enzyme [Alphaproteobacteria bacterium]MCB9785355.1 SUMF1/EgtB/PvdO family nonheme iron enzyme [Deltaproteobacteria bacterium]
MADRSLARTGVFAVVHLAMASVVACAGSAGLDLDDTHVNGVDASGKDTATGPVCGLLGEACPPGFECVPQLAPLLPNGIREWCYSSSERAVYVPGGPFWYGCNPLKQDPCPAWYDEPYQVEVTTRPYAILQSPVTVVEYEACEEAQYPGCDPVTGPDTALGATGWESVPWFPLIAPETTWYQAKAYCEWWGDTTGKPWRLCSEAEWEKAVLGGCETLRSQVEGLGVTCAQAARKYPWGDEATDCELQYRLPCNHEPPFARDPIGYHPMSASAYGVIDVMGGGGEQWVEDCAYAKTVPGIPPDGSARVADCFPSSEKEEAWRMTRGYQQDLRDSTAAGRRPLRPSIQSSGVICCRDM